MRNTVKLKRYVDIVNEYPAAAAITPGHLVELTSANTVQVHALEGGPAAKHFALEDELQGKTVTDAYVTGDTVFVWLAIPGSEVQAILADGENVAIGDKLISAGDGTLKKFVAASAGVDEYPLSIIGEALEAKDMSGSAGVDPTPQIAIRII